MCHKHGKITTKGITAYSIIREYLNTYVADISFDIEKAYVSAYFSPKKRSSIISK